MPDVDDSSSGARTVWIESGSRWDALALTRKLVPYPWFLVEPDPVHWDVYVPLPGTRRGGLPDDLLRRLVEWLDECDLESAEVHTQAGDLLVTRD